MWNLLVVEDESIVRMGLKYMIDWSIFQIQWVAETSNGEQAWQIIKEQEIHIVLTDIQMPGMNGLQLSELVSSEYPNIQIVFLSSYDHFDYVQQAIRLGGVDYLHKPTMDEDQLERTFTKVVQSLKETYCIKSENNHIDVSKTLLSMLDKYTFPKKVYLQDIEQQLKNEGYHLVVLRRPEDESKESNEVAELRFTSLFYFIKEYVMKTWGGIIFHRGSREVLWIAPANVDGQAVEAGRLTNFLEVTKQKVNDILNLTIIYTCSHIHQSITELPNAYMDALLELPTYQHIDNYIVRRAKKCIDENFLVDLSLSKVAEVIQVSSSYLSRIFLKEVGENFSDYIIRKKLEYAQRLLRETNRKIYDIAAEIGYHNPHYFSKLFKDRTGLTPNEYRNK